MSHSNKLLRLIGIVLLAMVISGCGSETAQRPEGAGPGGDADSTSSRTAVIQLNWYPESEHGGVYQAIADGTYQEVGLEVSVNPGGRATPIGPELELGRCQFAFANADDVVVFREQGINVVAVMAAMQNHPRCIIARADSGVRSFDDLAGKTFQRQAGRAFVEFMRAKGLLSDVKEVPYHGSIASMVADPDIIIQGYSCAEPLLAQQQGVEVNTLMVSDLGFNPYSSVIVTTDKLIESNPELVQNFVTATREGWRSYLSDASSGNELILAANEHGMTAEALEFGANVMSDLAMPDDATPDAIGTMSEQRWTQLFDQLAQLNLVDPAKVKATDCYTLRFLQ